MERSCTVAVSDGQITVTLSYYATAKATDAWLTRRLPPYDLADAANGSARILNDIQQADRRAIAAYKRAVEIQAALAGLNQRQAL